MLATVYGDVYAIGLCGRSKTKNGLKQFQSSPNKLMTTMIVATKDFGRDSILDSIKIKLLDM